MERHEAVELLKQLIAQHLVVPSLVALEKNKHGKFDLILKGDCDTQALKEFLSQRYLIVKENNEKGYCVISKP